jgi:hypothetical protein
MSTNDYNNAKEQELKALFKNNYIPPFREMSDYQDLLYHKLTSATISENDHKKLNDSRIALINVLDPNKGSKDSEFMAANLRFALKSAAKAAITRAKKDNNPIFLAKLDKLDSPESPYSKNNVKTLLGDSKIFDKQVDVER